MFGRSGLRPWGNLSWLWPHLGEERWSFVGCVGPEDRCLATWRHLLTHQEDVEELIFEIVDPPSRHAERIERITKQRRNDLIKIGVPSYGIREIGLLCPIEEVFLEVDQFIDRSQGRILLDISSFPKRIVLPIVKRIWNNENVKDFVACYTLPEAYGVELSEDPLPWDTIPTFGEESYPEREIDMVIVGVGYLPLGLSDILRTELGQSDIYPIFPVPPFSNRNWSFLRDIEMGLPRGRHVVREPVRVSAYNMSEAFDHLVSLTDWGRRAAILAPYGPKTISLAIAIFSILTGFPVYYTQPRTYSPHYSIGTSKDESNRDRILSYVLRSRGNDLYNMRTRSRSPSSI